MNHIQHTPPTHPGPHGKDGPAVPDPRAWRIVLPHTPAAVRLARALVRTALAETGMPVDRDTAELLTAELVANAVEHTCADTPVELVVELPAEGCRVEVRDGDPCPPGDLSPRADDSHPDPWQEHGRGLLLVRALSSACGHRSTPEGKAVWFTLRPRQVLPADV
ncbi:ATP-binding protein [Streptomyces sp. NPDC047014]|uniref:ATP-binding protein n=1 Tax=Streptomyces sp. NPDC047014 TaxID=3155736 RepID=UPI0033E40859